LASQEGLFPVTLVVIHCNDLTVIVLKMYKEAAVISALMKVYSIPCHDRGHINVMFGFTELYRSSAIFARFI
jgi:hypothetical protein